MTDKRRVDPGATRAPKSQMLRTVEAIAQAKAIGKPRRIDHRRQADQRAAGHDLAGGGHGAGGPHPHALLPRGPVPGRRLPDLRGGDLRPADAAGRVQLSGHRADPGLTHTPHVRRARRHILDLLLANHYGNCCTCVRNNHCELQALAAEYGVDFFRFGHLEAPRYKADTSSYSVVRDINKCVLCRRCIRTCIDLQEVGVLEAIGRGNRTRVSTFMEKPLAE